jgi:hypothetical protein
MQVKPSSIADLDLIGPDANGFLEALETLLGRAPDSVLEPALPFSTIVRNRASRAVALLGVRFDMTGPRAKSYSVIHYADTLRYPERAGVPAGAMRFVCAEPLYTDLVLRRGWDVDRRGPMNLGNLRKAVQIRASLDCAAFDDGQFAGPDSLGAFERLEIEREAEIAFLEEVLKPDCAIEAVVKEAMEVPAAYAQDRARAARRALARRLTEAFAAGGPDEVAARARNHRLRVQLRKQTTIDDRLRDPISLG